LFLPALVKVKTVNLKELAIGFEDKALLEILDACGNHSLGFRSSLQKTQGLNLFWLLLANHFPFF
jgi:hypothetical protein